MRSDIPQEEDPKTSASNKEAVFIGQQNTGDTFIIGREDKEEWLVTTDMRPLEVGEYR